MPRRVLITGAARGIGHSLAEAFARNGWVVGANYHVSETNAQALKARFPDQIKLMKFDARDYSTADSEIRRFVKENGELSLFINSAAMSCKPALFMRLEHAFINNLLSTNVIGAVNMLHIATKVTRKHKNCQIINFSSVAAGTTAKGMSLYSAGKLFLESATSSIANEIRSSQVWSLRIPPVLDAGMLADLPTDVVKQMADELETEAIRTSELFRFILLCVEKGPPVKNGCVFSLKQKMFA